MTTRVLWVDDESEGWLRALPLRLQRHHVVTSVAPDIVSARSAMADNPGAFDALMLDVILPHSSREVADPFAGLQYAIELVGDGFQGRIAVLSAVHRGHRFESLRSKLTALARLEQVKFFPKQSLALPNGIEKLVGFLRGEDASTESAAVPSGDVK